MTEGGYMPVKLEDGVLKFINDQIGSTPEEVLRFCVDDIEAGYWLCGNWSCSTQLNGFKHPKGCAMALIAMHSAPDLGRYHTYIRDKKGSDVPDADFDPTKHTIHVEWAEPDNVKKIANHELAAQVIPFVYRAIPQDRRD